MSEWEKCKLQFPTRTALNDPEKDHLSILFEDYFTATENAQHFLFTTLGDSVLWSVGPTHPWRYLDEQHSCQRGAYSQIP